ncbi:hypothetical protein D3C81_1845660 [compost metagenome]
MRQILHFPDAAGGLYAVNQCVRWLPGVEAIEAFVRQALECCRQFRLANALIECRYVAAMQEQPCAFRIVAQGRQAHGGAITVDAVNGKSFVGQANGRCQGGTQRQLAVVFGQVDQRCR